VYRWLFPGGAFPLLAGAFPLAGCSADPAITGEPLGAFTGSGGRSFTTILILTGAEASSPIGAAPLATRHWMKK
jgi:hypothetical protein